MLFRVFYIPKLSVLDKNTFSRKFFSKLFINENHVFILVLTNLGLFEIFETFEAGSMADGDLK